MTVVTIHRTVSIAASADAVFAGMTNWSRQSEWMPGTTVQAVHSDGKGVGDKINARTSFVGLGFSDPMTITEWTPPYKCTMLHTGRIVRGSGTFEVTAITKSTSEFTWSEDITLPFGVIGRAGWLIVRLPIGLGLQWSLRRFKRRVEQ